MIVDYKTDRLGAATPAEYAQRYETQRDIYALAVSEARGTDQVEVAYVFLERPEEPVVETLDRAAIEEGRARLETKIEGLNQVAPDSLAVSSLVASSSSFSSFRPSPTASSSAAQ